MRTHELSEYLRTGRDPNLRRRRAVVCLSLGAAATMSFIAAYQVGLINRLPEPSLAGFDSEKVNSSDEAYAKFQTPDALLGLGSYAATAILAAAGGKDRAKSHPWLPLAAAGKVLFDAGNAIKLTRDERTKHNAFCLYCLFATALTLGMVPLVFLEAREAITQLFGRSRSKETFPRGRQAISPVNREIEYPWSNLARREIIPEPADQRFTAQPIPVHENS